MVYIFQSVGYNLFSTKITLFPLSGKSFSAMWWNLLNFVDFAFHDDILFAFFMPYLIRRDTAWRVRVLIRHGLYVFCMRVPFGHVMPCPYLRSIGLVHSSSLLANINVTLTIPYLNYKRSFRWARANNLFNFVQFADAWIRIGKNINLEFLEHPYKRSFLLTDFKIIPIIFCPLRKKT